MPDITHDLILSYPRPELNKLLILRDDQLPGFGLRINKGSMSYIVESRINGKVRRITLGKTGELTPEAAREEARKVLAEMAAGNDPRPAPVPTLERINREYVLTKRLRPRTIETYKQIARVHFADWLHLPVTAITKEMVLTRHKELGGKVKNDTANHIMTHLRSLLYFAANNYETPDGQPVIDVNPVSHIGRNKLWYRTHKRQGVIPEHKLKDWYQAVVSLSSDTVRDFLLLITLTGLRRSEAIELKWSQVDFEARTLTIPPELSKNHREHILPLSSFLFELLKRRKDGKSEFVFPGRNGKHLQPPYEVINNIRARSLCTFSLHDLRRGFVSAAAKLNIPHYIIKRLINHIGDRDGTHDYIVTSTEELRESLEQINNRLLELMGCEIPQPDHKAKFKIATITLKEVFEEYMSGRELRPHTVRTYRKVMNRRLCDWLPLPITAITEEMVSQRHLGLTQ